MVTISISINERMIKMTNEEKRRQRRKNELGSQKPKCAMCGENDITALLKETKTVRTFMEEHHIAGSHEGETIQVCRNCHAKLTDKQLDWPEGVISSERTQEMNAVGFLFGLANLLELLAKLVFKFATILFDFVTDHQKEVMV